MRIVDYDVVKAYGIYVVPAHRTIRLRTEGAAQRLAFYRLRRFCRYEGMQIVSDVTFTTDADTFWIHGVRQVAAVARCTKAPVPDGFRIPDHVAVFRAVAGE